MVPQAGLVSGEQEQKVREKEEGKASCVPNSAPAGGPFPLPTQS